ncbi:MAG: dienelactone hydrolase family protein [Thaumarchaeota archaeon]|nr:MAG: dienelactone hydrolase family protein [Nitrososphaerota archaeon]
MVLEDDIYFLTSTCIMYLIVYFFPLILYHILTLTNKISSLQNRENFSFFVLCVGGQSLQLALNSQDHPLAATVIYSGRLVTEKGILANIMWPVLGIFGDQDRSISVDTVKAFELSLNSNGITNEIYIYKGVGHAFANPSGENYAPKETQDAWQKTLSFLNKLSS